MDRDTVAVVLQAKSVAMAILLTLFFGGLGVFYVSIPGGIIMSILTVIVWIISFVTFGIGGIFLIPLIHGISIIWGIVGVNNHNKKLTSTYLKEDAGTVQAADPSVPTEPQIQPRSERPVQEPTSDPQIAAKHQAYRIRIAKDPGNVALLGEYGDFLARSGNVDEALIQYFIIVELQPEDTSARRKIAELYKSQNNIPMAASQLRHILEIRQDDIEAKEELDRLYNSSANKSPSSPTPGEGEIPGPETLHESGKAEGNKKTGLLVFASIVSVALIAAVIFLIKQREPASFLQPTPTMEGRSGISPLPSPVPPQSMTSEALQIIPQEATDISTNSDSNPPVISDALGSTPFQGVSRWEGYYICQQGRTNLILDIIEANELNLKAKFIFSHPPSGSRGSFYLDGRYDPTTKHISFVPTQWIERPNGYVAVGMEGEILDDPVVRFEGNINGPGCGSFSVKLTTAN